VTTFPKHDTKGTLCDNGDDTCATMLETLGMSAINLYMIRMTHYIQVYPLKQAKTTFLWCATLAMPKDNIFNSKRKVQTTLEKCEHWKRHMQEWRQHEKETYYSEKRRQLWKRRCVKSTVGKTY